MEVNEKGEIAISYFQPIPKVVTVGKNQYAFVVRYGISLSWIPAEDAPRVLEIRNVCRSCNKSAPAFRYAAPLQIKVWNTGHY